MHKNLERLWEIGSRQTKEFRLRDSRLISLYRLTDKTILTQSSFSVLSARSSSSRCLASCSSEKTKSRTINLGKRLTSEYDRTQKWRTCFLDTSAQTHRGPFGTQQRRIVYIRHRKRWTCILDINKRRCTDYRTTHVEDRGTTIDVNRSYLEFQSFTRFLRTR